MSLRDVPDFVAHDAGEFAFGLCGHQQARVHGDKAPRQGKGVERLVADREEEKVVGRGIGGGHQAPAQAVEKVRDFRVGQIGLVRAHAPHELLAQTALVHDRQIGPGHVAQTGQIEFAHATRNLRAHRRGRQGQRKTDGDHGEGFGQAHERQSGQSKPLRTRAFAVKKGAKSDTSVVYHSGLRPK